MSMSWLRLVIACWQEHTLRTSVAAAGVAIAMGAFCSLISFNRGYERAVRSELDRLGAHVLVVPKGCPYDATSMALHGASWPCYLRQAYLQEVLSVPGIAAAAPVFMTALQVSNSLAVVYLGVDTNILALKRAWEITGHFPMAESAILIGAEVQAKQGWSLGQRVALPGLPGQFATVSGILGPTHGAEDGFIYLRLADAQRQFHHTNELTHILLRLADPDKLDQVVAQLRGCDAGLSMNVVPLAHVFLTLQWVVNSTRLLFACVALVALFVAGTGVSNTVMMSVAERTRELGMMRAIGASRAHVFALVWAETVQVCVLGAAAGQGAALLLRPAVGAWVRSKLSFVPYGALLQWDWGLPVAGLLCAVVLGSVAAFLPAWRAAQMPPVAAIRANELFG